jgi:hypothetical protein
VLYVYYGPDGKPYGPVITNEPDEEGRPHAEDIFERDHVKDLVKQIRSEQVAKREGEKVRVELNLNRLPCSHCSSLVVRLSAEYPDLQFVVKASSISNADIVQRSVPTDSEAHIGFIQEMIDKNVEVEPLAIFEAIWAKLLQVANAAKAGKVRLRNGSLAAEVTAARILLESSLAETQRVRELIAEAKRRAALAKVKGQGTAP